MRRFLGVNKMPIPLEAIEDFKRTLWIGAHFTVEKTIAGSGASPQKTFKHDFCVKSIKPYIAVATDGSSIQYSDLMLQSGWWDRNKWKYFGNERKPKIDWGFDE